MPTLYAPAARAAMLAAAPQATVALGDHPSDPLVTLSLLSLPLAERRQGHGTAALTALTAYADAHGVTLALTPDSTFGTPITALVALYRAHGFVPNHGRHKDYRTHQMMIRVPLDKTPPPQ